MCSWQINDADEWYAHILFWSLGIATYIRGSKGQDIGQPPKDKVQLDP